jgi:hypothetical protein
MNKVLDPREPMVKLLSAAAERGGCAEVEYDQQWRTLFKGIRLGYLRADFSKGTVLTDLGRAFVAEKAKASTQER